MTDAPGPAEAGAASALLDKLRDFAADLAPDERRVLAALLAPGVAAAWDEPESEVEGFVWRPDTVASHLAAEVRSRDLRIEGW